ncbi:MAG: hypothetical protein A2X34_04905 [Elusimicrobia bacterium GWC2_51_8]|nr:MAG: hypothetical protein A2X34_04905 [Elusimicrobia bacterium GWC2_51_8]
MSETTQKLSIKESLSILFKASKGFWLVNAVNFGDGIAYFAILTLLTRFLETRVGMSSVSVGLAVSMFTGLVTLFMFGGGFVSDKLGVRKAITFSLVSVLTGRILLCLAPVIGGGSLKQSLAWTALAIMAVGEGVIQPALYAGTKEYTDSRTATIGYGILYSIMNLGIVAGSFISPFIRTPDLFLNLGFTRIYGLGLGIDGVFRVCAGVTAIMLVNHLFFFTKDTEEKCRVVLNEAPVITGRSPTLAEKIKELPFGDWKFMFFIFILLPVRTLFAHQFLTMPDYVFNVFPPEVNAKFEWINGLNPLIIVVFVPLVAALTENVNVITMMIIGTMLSALTTFVLVPGPDIRLLMLDVILFSFGEALWSSRFLEYVAGIAPPGKIGAYMGLAGIPWFMAKFTTGLYSGAMIKRFIPPHGPQDSSTLWLIYGFIACITPVTLIIARKWLTVKKEGETKT